MRGLWICLAALLFMLSGCAAQEPLPAGEQRNPPATEKAPEEAAPPEEQPSREDPAQAESSAEPGAAESAESSTAEQAVEEQATSQAVSGPETQEEESEPVEILTLAVPEGYTLARIGMLLEEMGLCTVEEFIDTTQTMDVSEYPLAAAQQPDENRCFRLEGYLFPATYEIYSNEPPETIVRRMLAHQEKQLGGDMMTRIEQSGYTLDQILTLASIIEKESFGHEQMPIVSSVLHNRLEAGMKLQCDVTITYVEGAIKPFISGDVNRYNSYYNTYKCDALPAGAICNPGIAAIRAALAPADTHYYYFLTDEYKKFYYADTLDQHKENASEAGLE